MMKRIIVLTIFLSHCFLQASENSVKPYGGIGLANSLGNSDFNMNYEVNKTDFPDCEPQVSHKRNKRYNLGTELFAGVKYNASNNWFCSGELSYSPDRLRHRHNFTQAEDAEKNKDDADPKRISYINIKHQDELGLCSKLGKNLKICETYGIFGISSEKVKMKYALDKDHDSVEAPLETNPKKRVYGAVIGVGASKKINNQVSCAVEYKYKAYNSARRKVDLKEQTKEAFGGVDDHDTSDRNFKVHSRKHELSVRMSMNV